MADKTCVLGATGFVGRALVSALSDVGVPVRAASRRGKRGSDSVDSVSCDLERAETLGAVLEGCDAVYYLVHSLGRADFRETDRRCAHNVAEVAAAAGCQRIIYLGGVSPRGRASEHLASRLEVGEILRAGTVLAVELRASMIIGNGSASWRILRDLATRLPFMVLPRWLDSKTCPIALSDVITALLDARSVPLIDSAWFDIPGPEALSAREMLETVADLDGRRIPSIRVPMLTPALSAMWLRIVSGAEYAVARELVRGLSEDLLPQRSFWELAPHAPSLSFRAAAANALMSEKPSSGFVRAFEGVVRRLGPHAPRPMPGRTT
ncbi:MAG TPA: NAD(P)H-binding protein [Kofleriaceae bacterium]